MAETLVDIVRELNESYFKAKRNKIENKEKNLFLGILKNLFEIYGVSFGYENSKIGLSNFKSDLIRVKNRLKKAKADFKEKHNEAIEDFWKTVQLEPNYHPREGDGEIFTRWQVENLELNPDSY